MIIDSCIHINSNKPAALLYLDSLGVDDNAIKFIVATHWHDDHIRGLSDLIEKYSEAQFCCSMAMSTDEFIANVETFGARDINTVTSGVREIYRALRLIRGKGPKRAIANRSLFVVDGENSGHGRRYEVSAYSGPS